MRPDLIGLPRAALADTLSELDVPAYHALRVFGGLHKRGLPLREIPDLGWRVIERLESGARVTTLEPVEISRSSPVQTPDGALPGVEKMLFELGGGARVEGVLIPTRPGRFTLCVSSQVGCAMGCAFCATATLGLTRSLTSAEIIAQVHAARRRARALEGELTHVVFMGMGEPLHAWSAVRDALKIMLDPAGLCMKARHITVSTVGLIQRIARLGEEFGGRVQLALSLHAGTDETRRRIIPPAAKYTMASLREALEAYPLPGSRMLMLEYVVLPGINDTEAEIEALALWARGLRAVINLIPFNPFPQDPTAEVFDAPTDAQVLSVATRLKAAGLLASVRWPRGRGVDGACGQLALRDAQGASRSAT